MNILSFSLVSLSLLLFVLCSVKWKINILANLSFVSIKVFGILVFKIKLDTMLKILKKSNKKEKKSNRKVDYIFILKSIKFSKVHVFYSMENIQVWEYQLFGLISILNDVIVPLFDNFVPLIIRRKNGNIDLTVNIEFSVDLFELLSFYNWKEKRM